MIRVIMNAAVFALGLTLFGLVLANSTHVEAQQDSIQILEGEPGSSPRWGCGWLDLTAPMDFSQGDRLRLKIGGTATRIMVRLLSRGMYPETSAGIVGGPITVPENRIVNITLETDRREVIQISVHGGPNPFDKFPLGGGNGPATLETAERIRP